jgi:hypothetical protein
VTPEQGAAEAAAALASFHRAALIFGLLCAAGMSVRWAFFKEWPGLGLVGPVISAALSGYAIPEAAFPLYWTIWRARPITDIAADWLDIYVYIGSALIMLVSVIAIREAWK